MLKHETFEELCALAATGELSAEDETRLVDHLRECESCRTACADFSAILRELPADGATPADKSLLREMEEGGLRDRFLDHARAGGVRFSSAAVESQRALPRDFTHAWRGAGFSGYQRIAASVFAIAAIGLAGYRVAHKYGRTANDSPTAAASRPSEIATPRASSTDDTTLTRLSNLENLKRSSEQTIASLTKEKNGLVARVGGLETELKAAQGDKQDLTRTISHLNDANAQLASQNEVSLQELVATKAELEKVRATREHAEGELTAVRAELGTLKQQMRTETASLAQDRQLLTVGRDVTNLMAARSLHVIDVYDGDGRGNNKKAFGRVFYTEGKSLIFYAYDLDEKKLADAKYSFEAWGQRQADPQSAKSLGILYSDDKGDKRWVLKVDNPDQLREIDSVFVTLEPHGASSDKPTGQKLLFAFLGSKANHP
jgi:hypothetical protein